MITIISGTNRPNSRTKMLADLIAEKVRKHGTEKVELVDLCDIYDEKIDLTVMYGDEGQHHTVRTAQDSKIIPADKWIIVVPEYNGGFPGIFKLFIDALSVRKYKETFAGKKVCLFGIAAGRAGNLRGLDQLTNVLNYLKMDVFHLKTPVSSCEILFDSDDIFEEETQKVIEDSCLAFIKY